MINCALIVEDDPNIARLTEVVVHRHCDTVDLAIDGQEAIDMLRQKRYELLVLDIMLPRANGFEVAAVAQALPEPPKIIVLSAIARYFAERFPSGTQVLQKPFELKRLESIISTLLGEAPSVASAG